MNEKKAPDVSISIVSMAKPDKLTGCIDSIMKYTVGISYEILVVAYLYPDTLVRNLRAQYSTITVIESNETRGFSENHNLALRQAKGKYCVVLNDDTFIDRDVFSILAATFSERPETGFVSPVLLYPDGRVQLKGRERFTFYSWLRTETTIGRHREGFTGDDGGQIFETYGISGACFMIRRTDFVSLGMMDERYFFTPEDVALGEKGIKRGMKCCVDTRAVVYHINAASSSAIFGAIIPVGKQGMYILMNDRFGAVGEIAARVCTFIIAFLKLFYWMTNSDDVKSRTMMMANRNIIRFSFLRISPKKLFVKLMKEITLDNGRIQS